MTIKESKRITILILTINKRQLISLLFGVFFMVGDYFIQTGIMSVFGFALVFNWTDLVGYQGIIKGRVTSDFGEEDHVTPSSLTLQSYRILQASIQVLLLTIVLMSQGVLWVVLAETLHIFGVIDMLYYLIGGYNPPTHWTWMDWTVIGWFWKKEEEGDKIIPHSIIVAQAIFGLVLVLAMTYLLKYIWVI